MKNLLPLAVSPVQSALDDTQVTLPPAVAPRLEDISVTVPQPAGVTDADVQRRFAELARAHATTHHRTPSEKVAAGDEVLLDVVGYSRGRLIPFSLRTDLWQLAEPDPNLPGFYERLIGQPVRQSYTIPLTLPDGYPVQSLRGAPARFVVDLKAARSIQPLRPEELLKALGRGKSQEEVLRSIRRELEEAQAARHRLETTNHVLDELAARTQVEVPAGLVNTEIQHHWALAEGSALAKKEFTCEEQQESLNGWLGSANLRRDVERRLRISLALGAVCARDHQLLTPELVRQLLAQAGQGLNVPPEEALRGLGRDPKAARQFEQAAWHLMAVEYVMSRVTVKVAPALA